MGRKAQAERSMGLALLDLNAFCQTFISKSVWQKAHLGLTHVLTSLERRPGGTHRCIQIICLGGNPGG